MKTLYRKIVGGGTARKIATTLLMMLLVAALPLSTFAINPGDSVSYRVTGNECFQITGDSTWRGKCAQSGKEDGGSGSGTVSSKFDNNSTEAKLAYYYNYVDNKYNSSEEPFNDVVTTWGQQIGRAISYANWDKDTWRSSLRNTYSDHAVEEIEDLCKEMIRRTSNVDVPSGFEMYYVKNNNSNMQSFVIWRFSPTGSVKLKKASANPSITG